MSSDPLSVLGEKCLSSSFRGLVNHNNLAGVVLTDSSVERFNAEFSMTFLSQIAVKRFDPLAKWDIILRVTTVVMDIDLKDNVDELILTTAQARLNSSYSKAST